MSETNSETADEGPQYAYRPSVMGAPRVFRLAADGLHWNSRLRSGLLRYDQLTRMRLSFRPVAMQPYRFVAEIWSSEAPRLDIVSSSWKSMFEQDRLDADYRAFIAELHRRLAATGSTAVFEIGVGPLRYWVGVVVVAATALALAALTARSLQFGAIGAGVFIAGFLAFFLWRAGTFLRRNRPARYRPEAVPPDILPQP